MKTYNKLVRDKIPEIIKAEGKELRKEKSNDDIDGDYDDIFWEF